MADRLLRVLAPAVNGAFGTVRGNRLISLPSRSEVRLAYSAVVTWKGELSSRLEQAWRAVHTWLVDLGLWLEQCYREARLALASRAGAGRLALLRPLLERHGVLASVALLGCAMLLLGLTSRDPEPDVVVSPLRSEPAPVLLGAVAAAPAIPAAPAAPSEPAPAPVTPADPPAAASVPPKTSEHALATEHAAVATTRPPVVAASGRASAPSHAEPAPAAPAERRAEKPITMAMAQAAAKILTADELVASVPTTRAPAAKAAPRSAAAPSAKAAEPAPKAAPKASVTPEVKATSPAPRRPAPSAPSKRSRSSERAGANPFDDRL
jgi:hypothetical protein